MVRNEVRAVQVCFSKWKNQNWTHSACTHPHTNINKCWWSHGCPTTLRDSGSINNVSFAPEGSSSIPSFLPTSSLLSFHNLLQTASGNLNFSMKIDSFPWFPYATEHVTFKTLLYWVWQWALNKNHGRFALWWHKRVGFQEEKKHPTKAWSKKN